MAFDIGPFPGDPGDCESFQVYVTGPPKPSFCLSSSVSVAYGPFEPVIPDPFFALFRPVAVTIVSPLSPLSVVSGQINAEAVLHVSETKGDARVPGSHLITHLGLLLP